MPNTFRTGSLNKLCGHWAVGQASSCQAPKARVILDEKT